MLGLLARDTLSAADFEWHGDANEYRCPEGRAFRSDWRQFKNPRDRITKADTNIYRSSPKDCAHCPDKQKSCPNTPMRRITRSIYESSRDVARSLSGCAVPVKKDMSAFIAAAPRSILVVPAVNRSLDVDAPNYLLSTLSIPLAEKGFYVFPVNTSKVVLEQEGFYEAEQVRKQSPQVLAMLFGADAVLYVTINRWDAQYILLSTTVTVEFDYRIVSKVGVEIWSANQKMQYSPQNSSGGNPIATLVAAAITAAMTRAAPNYLPLAQMANRQAFVMGPNPIPNGPYAIVAGGGPAAMSASSGGMPQRTSAAATAVPAVSVVSVVPLQNKAGGATDSAITTPGGPTKQSTGSAKIAVQEQPAPPKSVGISGTGQDAFQALRLAKELACTTSAQPLLTAKGPGAESYSVTCSNGQVLSIQCSFGTCQSVK